MEKAITYHNVDLGYGKEKVISSATFKLHPGRIYCVFGRNGSGKTTLLKSLAGMIPTKSGQIEINGSELSTFGNEEKARLMSVVLTNPMNISSITVKEFIAFGRYPYRNWLGLKGENDDQVVEEALKLCHLEELAEKDINNLSDGEMQKVQIARALSQDTDILLLDEPASHLDLVNKAEIFKILKQIASAPNKLILFTSHDIQFSLQLAHDFIVVSDGEVRLIPGDEFRSGKVYDEVMRSDLIEIDADQSAIRFKAD